MWEALKRLFGRYGFHRQPPVYHHSGSSVGPVVSPNDVWWAEQWCVRQHSAQMAEGARNVANDLEYRELMAVGALNMAPHAVKTRRLAAIARERDALKDQLAKAIKAKKARAPIYAALRALSIEELRVETGK